MIINEQHPQAMFLSLELPDGVKIEKVKSFNTETKEAELYAMIPNNKQNSLVAKTKEGGLITFKCYLPEAKLYNKKSGEEVV